jgi:predicted DCC family thiol-disulfide oxidoreductase YuxK
MNQYTNQEPVIVLYDGSCPLCSREIAHYRRRKGASGIKWIDASKDLVNLESLGISQFDALSVFHVRDPSGQWHIGVQGFILVWSQLPAYHWLARLVMTFRLTGLLQWGYRHFLGWRNSPARCTDDRCSSSSNSM